jgi:hypothetical protein
MEFGYRRNGLDPRRQPRSPGALSGTPELAEDQQIGCEVFG